MTNQPARQQQISEELETVYKHMAELYDRVQDLSKRKFSPLSQEMQKARVEFEELNRKKISLLKEVNYSWIIPDTPEYDAGLE